MENNRTYADPNYADEGLSYEKLRETLDRIPKFEFSAFTVNDRGKSQLFDRLNVLPESADSLFGRPALTDHFGGIPLYVVGDQIDGFIKWTDKAALDTYLQMMGERPVKDQERFDALKKLSALATLPWNKVVINTIDIPTARLVEALPYVEHLIVMPVFDKNRELGLVSEFSKTFREKLGELDDFFRENIEKLEKRNKQKKRKKNQPTPHFFDKYTRRKRR